MLEAAERVAAQGDSQLPTRAWVASVQAEVAAAQGDASEAERALDQARTVLELSAPGGWLRFTGDRLPEQRASAYITLGRYDQAEAELDIALGASVSPRRSAAILTDRTRLAVHRRDYEAAASHIQAVLELATRTRSGYVLGKLSRLETDLRRSGATGLAETLSETTKGQT